MRRTTPLLLLAACGGAPAPVEPGDTAPPVDDGWPVGVWNRRLPDAAAAIAPVRGRVHARAVFHLHSPYSHDACDGKGWKDGVLDEACLADLREGLCATRFDAAFLTDHPAHADRQPFEALFHHQDGDAWVREGDVAVASEITCDDGHVVRWRVGFEDDLMPVGLRRHVHDDPAVRNDLLNRADPEALAAMRAAGAHVMLAHTEGRDLARLEALQDAGLHAVEAFNVHAMFAPNIRGEDLGLDPLGWLEDIGPFIAADATAEPDLYFLGVLQEQAPSVAKWDALLARGPMMATAGTDAHQNVLAYDAADGERVDSFRRMLRWFSTMLIVDERSVDGIDDAIAARRAFVAFEVLGTPTGLDVHVEAEGAAFEMGSDAPEGDLVVACPTLADGSPRGDEAPEITVTVYRDGAPWQTGCGRWPAARGVYRVRVDVVPHHLRPFLGPDPDRYLKSYPWIYSGAIRVGMGG